MSLKYSKLVIHSGHNWFWFVFYVWTLWPDEWNTSSGKDKWGNRPIINDQLFRFDVIRNISINISTTNKIACTCTMNTSAWNNCPVECLTIQKDGFYRNKTMNDRKWKSAFERFHSEFGPGVRRTGRVVWLSRLGRLIVGHPTEPWFGPMGYGLKPFLKALLAVKGLSKWEFQMNLESALSIRGWFLNDEIVWANRCWVWVISNE